jgi:hypothetical protein
MCIVDPAHNLHFFTRVEESLFYHCKDLSKITWNFKEEIFFQHHKLSSKDSNVRRSEER